MTLTHNFDIIFRLPASDCEKWVVICLMARRKENRLT